MARRGRVWLGIIALVAGLAACANTYSTSFGTSKHDGVASVRYVAYRPDCTCFRYTSGPKTVP